MKLEWNLDDILPREDFDTTYQQLEDALPQYAEWFEKLSPEMSEEDFQAFSEWDDANTDLFHRVYCLGMLAQQADQKSEDAMLMMSRVEGLHVKLSDAERGITFWLKGIDQDEKPGLDDENAERLFAAVPDYKETLERSRELAKFTLSKKEEEILSAIGAFDQTVDMRDLEETTQSFWFKPEGAKRGKTIHSVAGVMKHVHSPEHAKREEAYRTMLETFAENKEMFFMAYSSVVKKYAWSTERRGHSSPISRRNAHNNIPDEAVDALIETTRENRDVFHTFFSWKAKELGYEKLSRPHIYAPLETVETTVGLQEGIPLVLDTFEDVSPRFAEYARRIIEAKHIHSHPDKNKSGGAFCMTVCPDVEPYVLLNWTDTNRDVETLAHELGHGVHALYAAHLPIGAQHSPMPLAETASTFAESVLFDRMFEEATPEQQKSMLVERMGGSFGTVLRQNYITVFEKKAHACIPEGVTVTELQDMWLDTLHEQFGDAVDIPDMFRHEWSYIPHIIHSPFYCYSYTFGELLSMSLYDQYKQDPAFFSSIEHVLSAGGSRNPDRLLQEVGIDIKTKEFWQGGFNIIRGWQNELEKYK